nr:26S proteasome non-ATPase regulatory subunit 1 homolog A-like [Ipomoea batatas]
MKSRARRLTKAMYIRRPADDASSSPTVINLRTKTVICIVPIFESIGSVGGGLALGAGPLFDVFEESDYVHTLLDLRPCWESWGDSGNTALPCQISHDMEPDAREEDESSMLATI